VTPRELMTEYLRAARSGDWDTAFGYFADDIVMHVPGRSRLAGDREGKEAAMAYIQAIREHYRDGEIELELVDMLDSGERVALLVRERFRREGETIEIRRANVYRVERDAIVEISIFEADQYAVDDLTAGI
jgi:uncharacterized protein